MFELTADSPLQQGGRVTTFLRQQTGQTEPLAALVSVAVICVAVSTFAGLTTSVVEEHGTERDVSEPALDAIWYELSTDGVVDPAKRPLDSASGASLLPEGRFVHANITVVGAEGTKKTLDSITVTPNRTRLDWERVTPPSTKRSADRPIPVRVGPGDVRPGRLTVVVWS